MSHVIFGKRGRAGIITLNRPEAMNALNLDMIRRIDTALDQFVKDPAVSCVILNSSSDRAFCAGGDMRRVRELVLDGKRAEAEKFFEEEYALIEKISVLPKPYVSLIDGICMGGGMGLSVHGTYRIATERALFAMPETAIGFIPDVGGSYLLPRMPEYCGIWMGLTGASVRGFDAHGLGISTHMAATETLPELLDDLCHSSQPIDETLSKLCASTGHQFDILMLSDTTACFGQPTLRTIVKSLEQNRSKRKEAALKALRNASPRSLQETLTLLRRGKELSLSECLAQEFEAMRHAIRHPDLAEGVRAVLVDKDHAPNWQKAG
ncbi:3-hydroxyisobutyrate dehydrogenase [Ruegeria sp. THAF57]|uniref:enoyl-CoA hydratase/isomerase family protein n=1 Tax=Ruegeria sp. THAF57 TaxID=2744555 RepID=UPI0015DDE0C3|nr:enoyl-CoA hydratase/isomerase family protein [Ruegeria sp. THAF57]CAD0187275.1 3-hydroxyisobutyrate dehydrogenase [Ruegeria sp. THAF57]